MSVIDLFLGSLVDCGDRTFNSVVLPNGYSMCINHYEDFKNVIINSTDLLTREDIFMFCGDGVNDVCGLLGIEDSIAMNELFQRIDPESDIGKILLYNIMIKVTTK